MIPTASRRKELLLDARVCPPFLSSLVAPREVVADHVVAPVFLFGRKVASVEVFFGAPVVMDGGGGACNAAGTVAGTDGSGHAGVGLSARSMTYTVAQRHWYDFAVHPFGDDVASMPQQQQRRVKAAGDWSWLRNDVKPEALDALERCDAQSTSCPVIPGSHPWRLLVVELLCAWISNSLVMQRHEAFVDTIALFNERLAFEYHSYLCGIGDTSAPWHLVAMRQAPAEWIWLHPRATFQLQRDQKSGNSPSLLRCRIPLLCDPDAVRSLRSNVEAWMELFCKLSGIPCVEHLAAVHAAEIVVSAVAYVDLELVNSVAYRVVYESISTNFRERHVQEQLLDSEALQALGAASSSDDDVVPCEPYSTHWWCDLLQRSSTTTGDALRLESVAASPLVSPRGAPSSPRSASATGASSTTSPPPPTPQSPPSLPSFSVMHRTHNATLMEYIPLLEARLIAGCIGDALHFLSLIHTLTETFGPPAAVSCAVKDALDNKQRRFATFRMPPSLPEGGLASAANGEDAGGEAGASQQERNTPPEVAKMVTIVVTVVYDTPRTLPVVTVSSPGRNMPHDADKPLAANVRLRSAQAIGSLGADENFNVLVMTQCIVCGVHERRQQIIDICTIQAADDAAALQRAASTTIAVETTRSATPPTAGETRAAGVGAPVPVVQHHIDPIVPANASEGGTPVRQATLESTPSTPKSSMPSPGLMANDVCDETEMHPELCCTRARASDAEEEGDAEARPTLDATATPDGSCAGQPPVGPDDA